MTGNRKVGVFVVETDAPGVTLERQDTTTGIPEARMVLTGAKATLLGDTASGAAIVDWITLRATAALAATAVGVCEAALRITADYTKTREQFGRPIATFQAVGQRAADAYIDTEAVRLTALQAAWRITADLPAEAEVAIAKFWAADGGQRVVHAAQHLHGGMGVDRDYPVHRYFLWAKHLELSLGVRPSSCCGWATSSPGRQPARPGRQPARPGRQPTATDPRYPGARRGNTAPICYYGGSGNSGFRTLRGRSLTHG